MKKVLLILLALVMTLTTFAGCGKKDEGYINKEFIPQDPLLGRCYETEDKCINWGKYQKNPEDLPDSCIEIFVGSVYSIKTKEEFAGKIKMFKDELDVIGSDYAFAYYGEKGNLFTVKIEKSKMGLPTFALFNINYSHQNTIVSQMGDLTIEKIENLSYTVNTDLKLQITVDIPESDREKLENYIKENVGGMLYLKLGDLTFSAKTITEDMSAHSVTFTGTLFLGSNVDESQYQFLARLAQYNVNNKNDGEYSMGFPTVIEKGDEYDVKYITYMDECVINNINSLYTDTTFERRDIANEIYIHFDIDCAVVHDNECLDRVKALYELCGFDSGAYSQISFTWPSEEEGYNDYVIFTKKEGKMICSGYSDRLEGEVTNHPFTKNYIEY